MGTNREWTSINDSRALSIRLVRGMLFWYLGCWSAVAISTLLAQLLRVPFKYYAVFCGLSVAIITALVLFRAIRATHVDDLRSSPREWRIIAGLVALSLISAALSFGYHTTGRAFLDDFYLIANPTYYRENPLAPMGFEARSFYSGGAPIVSHGFLTAGAYELGLAIPAYLVRIPYLLVYYRLAAVANAILLVGTAYFAIAHFAEHTGAALAGAGAMVGALIIMSENSWSVGELALVHGYEGKAILFLVGIPLSIVYVLDLLKWPSAKTWLPVFMLITAMTGMSTSALMLLPLTLVAVFVAFGFTAGLKLPGPKWWLQRGLLCLGASSYLLIVAGLLAVTDRATNAQVFNVDYPDSFWGYVRAYLASGTWPATPLIALAGWLLAILWSRRPLRLFVSALLASFILVGLNPLSASLLLTVFRGIYFRLFYVLFHPLFLGVAVAVIVTRLMTGPLTRARAIVAGAATCTVLAATLFSPSSLVANPRYTFGNWTPTEDYVPAQKILNSAPPGLMLAPYPLSGTVRMISSAYPQLEGRADMLSFYLGQQGRAADATARIQANAFLSGEPEGAQGFANLLDRYPEIRSVVFSRSGLPKVDTAELDALLRQKGFTNHRAVEKYVVYWR